LRLLGEKIPKNKSEPLKRPSVILFDLMSECTVPKYSEPAPCLYRPLSWRLFARAMVCREIFPLTVDWKRDIYFEFKIQKREEYF
jgi:hypothetical protein